MEHETAGTAGGDRTSWGDLLAETRQRLTLRGIDEAEISARRIIEEASGWDGANLGVHLKDLATKGGVAHLDAMVARRLTGEPLQYVLGRWSFRMLDLMVDQRVLIPRPETEEVAGLAIALVKKLAAEGIAPVVADLGTGTGAIGLSIAAEIPKSTVHLTDLHDDAIAVARANTAGLGRRAARVSIHQGSWFESLPTDLLGSVDVAVANPPYVATADPLPSVVADWEPMSALLAGHDGLDDLRIIVAQATTWLSPAGALVLEMDPRQTPVIAQLCLDHGFRSAEIHADLTGTDRAVVALLAP